MPSLSTLQRLEVEVGADVDPAERELRDFTRRAGDGSGGGLFGGLASAGVAAFAAIGAGAAAAGGWGLSIAMEGEQAAISFTTMLGSAEAAGAFLEDLRAFAATTPFEFPELQQAASSLVSAGFEASQVIPIMTTLGDVTSGMGTGAEGVQRATVALQQMSAAGRISGEDLNQLRDAGIPVFDLLASATGKSREEISAMAQAGTLGRTEMEALFTALETGGGGLERFSGLMEAQSQSLGGMLSTLKDTVGQSLAGAMSPVVEQLKGQLPAITTLIGDTLTSLGPSIATLAGGLVELAGGLLPVLAPIVGTIAEIAGALMSAIGPVLTAVAPILGQIASTLGGALVGALETIGPALPPLVVGLARIVEGIAGPLANAIAQAAPLFVQLITAVTPLLGPLGELATTLINALLPAILPLLPPIISLIETLVGTEEAAGPLITIIEMLAGVITAIPTPVLSALVIGLIALSNPITAVALAASFLVANWDGIAAFFVGLWDTIIGAFSTAWGWIAGFLAGIPGAIVGFFDGAWDWLYGAGVGILGGLANGASSALGSVWDFLTGIPGMILDAIGDAGALLLQTGMNVVWGLWDGLVDAGDWVADHIVGWLRDILPGPVERFLGISSPSRLAMGWGEMVGAGMALGLESQIGTVAAMSDRLALAASPTMRPFTIGAAGLTPPGSLAAQLAPFSGGGTTGGGADGRPIEVTLALNESVLARILVDPLRSELVDAGAANSSGFLGGIA